MFTIKVEGDLTPEEARVLTRMLACLRGEPPVMSRAELLDILRIRGVRKGLPLSRYNTKQLRVLEEKTR